MFLSEPCELDDPAEAPDDDPVDPAEAADLVDEDVLDAVEEVEPEVGEPPTGILVTAPEITVTRSVFCWCNCD